MSQGTTPPGWYDDGSGAQRWWDGARWTDHTQPGIPAPPAAGPPPTPAYGVQQPQQPQSSDGRRRSMVIAAVAGAALLIVAGIVVLVVVLGGDDDDTDRAGGEPTDSSSATSSEPTVPDSPRTAETPTAPPLPELSEPPTQEPDEPVGPADAGQTTCGQIRASSEDELIELLDRAARDEVAQSGDEDAQAYLDLTQAEKRQFAAFLPTVCDGQDDDTTLDDIEDF